MTTKEYRRARDAARAAIGRLSANVTDEPVRVETHNMQAHYMGAHGWAQGSLESDLHDVRVYFDLLWPKTEAEAGMCEVRS